MITVDSKWTAWKLVNELINTSYYKDDEASKRAGYDIYTCEDENIHISNLDTRLEINYADGTTINIWIDESNTEIYEAKPEIPETKPKNIKEKLTNKIYELIDKEEYDNIYKLLELIRDYKDIIE